ncbi:unnamed protein product [Peniophora sp. CBMAI 1063]|nr:unnamed protein product [Peniophora sp. CBMAI 1063]
MEYATIHHFDFNEDTHKNVWEQFENVPFVEPAVMDLSNESIGYGYHYAPPHRLTTPSPTSETLIETPQNLGLILDEPCGYFNLMSERGARSAAGEDGLDDDMDSEKESWSQSDDESQDSLGSSTETENVTDDTTHAPFIRRDDTKKDAWWDAKQPGEAYPPPSPKAEYIREHPDIFYHPDLICTSLLPLFAGQRNGALYHAPRYGAVWLCSQMTYYEQLRHAAFTQEDADFEEVRVRLMSEWQYAGAIVSTFLIYPLSTHN